MRRIIFLIAIIASSCTKDSLELSVSNTLTVSVNYSMPEYPRFLFDIRDSLTLEEPVGFILEFRENDPEFTFTPANNEETYIRLYEGDYLVKGRTINRDSSGLLSRTPVYEISGLPYTSGESDRLEIDAELKTVGVVVYKRSIIGVPKIEPGGHELYDQGDYWFGWVRTGKGAKIDINTDLLDLDKIDKPVKLYRYY